VRKLLILTKRQITDDGPYLVGALGAAIVFLLALAASGFVYLEDLFLSVVTLLLVLPCLVATGFYLVGLLQSHVEKHNGMNALLSVLSTTGVHILLARFISGMLIVLIVVAYLSLTLAGAIRTGLVGWPDSLGPGGLLDMSAALFEVGLASYCLGLIVARKAETVGAGLRGWPLALIPASLVVTRGFGRPLDRTLVPFIAILLLHLLSSVSRRRLAAITRVCMIVVLVMVPLYWLRYWSDFTMTWAALEFSHDIEVPCHYRFWSASAKGDRFVIHGGVRYSRFPIYRGEVHFLLRPLGIMRYLRAKEPGGGPINLRDFGGYDGLYFDGQKGLLVRRDRSEVLYAGPHGVAELPLERLGVFKDPITCIKNRRPSVADSTVVFDPDERCFYAIHFGKSEVRRGPRLDAAFQPVDAMACRSAPGACFVNCGYPWVSGPNALYAADRNGIYVPIVGESGSIALLDRRTLELRMDAGCLPFLRASVEGDSLKPRDCLDYAVGIIVRQSDGEYSGLMVTTLSRLRPFVTVAVFDKNGRRIGRAPYRTKLPSILPLGPLKYLVESFHPPVLALASFFTAYSFDAGATHRAVFLMPNSFVALQRDRQTHMFFQLLWALLFMVPALLFAGFLGWRVVRDARVMGLSRRSRRLWLLGTLAFGLPAYITYRRSRPQVVSIHCRNCGNLRRADLDRCHHCGSPWDVPALDAPAWRITDASH